MQFNQFQREIPMNANINSKIGCYGNYINNNYVFPQQFQFMNQHMTSSDFNSNTAGKNQFNFIYPANNLMSPNEQSSIPLATQIPKKRKIEDVSHKLKEHNESNKKAVRKQFTKEEDQLLLELVEKYGDKKWKQISKRMPNRSTRQCHERYKYFLSPKLSNNPWTDEECIILEMKYQEIGPKWAEIATFLNNRSAVSVKNKWGALERKKQLRAMIPLINELYLTNHKILKGINFKKLRTKSKNNSSSSKSQQNSNLTAENSNHNSDYDDLSDLFNDDSEESNENEFNSMIFDNDSENYDDLLSIWDNEGCTF